MEIRLGARFTYLRVKEKPTLILEKEKNQYFICSSLWAPTSANLLLFYKNKIQDQNICPYFSRHGTCKYGSACKYDHPVSYNSNSNPAREGHDGSNGPKHMIHQSV